MHKLLCHTWVLIKMISVLRLYADCHNIFNCAKQVFEDDIVVFEHHVTEFMSYFRSNWPRINISPKLHLLEYHTADFLRLWGTGCGFYGEQAAESAHNGINRMKSSYANVKNDLKRLGYTTLFCDRYYFNENRLIWVIPLGYVMEISLRNF